MQTITRKKGAFYNEEFQVNLQDYGKSSADIEDIFFSVKAKLTNPDNAVILKKLSNAEITFTGTKNLIVTVVFNTNDTDICVIDQIYDAGLFLKFVGDPVADENINQTFQFKVTQDFLIDN